MIALLLLVLLPSLALTAQSTLDWTKCGTENIKCYCPKAPGDLELVQQKLAMLPVDKTNNCKEIGIHSKFFNEDIALLQLQVIGDTTPRGSEPPTLMFSRGTKELFGCVFKSTGVELASPQQGWKNMYKISLFEDLSKFELGDVLCAIKLEKANKFAKDEMRQDKTTEMKWTISQDSSKKFASTNEGKDLLTREDVEACDPYSFKELTVHERFHVLPVPGKDKDILTCEKYGPSYTMKYDKSDKTTVTMDKLTCTKDNIYTLSKRDDAGQPEPDINIFVPGAYTVYCAAEINEVCKDPRDCTEANDPNCPIYKPGNVGEAATITCKDKKWVIDGQYMVLDKQPVCDRDSVNNQNGAAFQSTHKGNDVRIEKDARCFTEYDGCKQISQLLLPNCKGDDTKCGAVDESDKMKLKCADEKKQMTVKLAAEPSVTINVTHLTCNPTTGLWRTTDAQEIPASSVVKCLGQVNVILVITKAEMSDGTVDGIIWGSAGGIVALMLIGAAVAFFIMTRKHKADIKEKKEFLKMKKAERIAECKELLPQALLAAPSTSNLIVEALNLIDLMLDMEMENLKVWDDAFHFLLRVHGVIWRMDHALGLMFSRYMYMEGKKIIDKHSWLTTKPIRKKTTKGVIRVVAIRLLSFALNDPTNDDAEQLLIAGYRKLGFFASSQYPHCGLMWSVIMHTRPLMLKHNTGPQNTRLNVDYLMATLRDIGCKKKRPEQLPEDQLITGMGSIAQQAAYAYGASTNLHYQMQHMIPENAWLKWAGNEEKGEVPLAFLEGLSQSLTHNPVCGVIAVCNVLPEPNPTLFEGMKKLATDEKWHAAFMGAIRHAIYYGQGLDAMRMRTLFLPKTFDEEIIKMQGEQQLFDEAMEKAKEEIRGWLGGVIDKEELKKKPDYTVKSSFKIDSRIKGEGGTTDLTKIGIGGSCSPANSKSDTKSDTKTNSSDEAPGAAATAAAATPAAAPAASPAAAPAAPPAAAPAAPPAAAPAAPAAPQPPAPDAAAAKPAA